MKPLHIKYSNHLHQQAYLKFELRPIKKIFNFKQELVSKVAGDEVLVFFLCSDM